MDLGHRTLFNPTHGNHPLIPRKRRRSSETWTNPSRTTMHRGRDRDRDRDQDMDVSMSSDPSVDSAHNGAMTNSTSKLTDRNVAPFLVKHIPEQHPASPVKSIEKSHEHRDKNSVHCCRHRSDLKCRRQADEPSMDQLQRVSSHSKYHSDDT